MLIRRLDDQEPFTTRDGSIIRDEIENQFQAEETSEVVRAIVRSLLNEAVERRAIAEMRHAEKLMARILFLEGEPIVSSLNKMTIGADVPAQLDADLYLEMKTVERYNKAIALAGEVLDYATRDMLQEILVEEDAHVDGIEELQDQIEQMSLQIFLSTQS